MNSSAPTKGILVLLFGIVGSLFLLAGGILAQNNSERRFFPQTGHIVERNFLRFFDEHGGLLVFGYPISQDFEYQGLLVQYFYNGRLEMDSSSGRVRLSPLPVEFGSKRTDSISRDQVPAGGEFFGPTKHSVMGAFLTFYHQYGGTDVFGYPITELINEDDRTVQYFERGIFEWRPELPEGQKVQLSRLGEVAFQIARHDPALLRARPDTITPTTPITHIDVSAAVHSPVTSPQDEVQIVYVYVSDQLSRPVPDAQVEVTVTLPNGDQEIPPVSTDRDGRVIISLSISSLPAGETILIQVKASHQQLQSDTATAFRTWW